ncbi:MAG: hypothetical protein J0I57_19420 [Hyphomicrobium sp.]|nr:hypothetical protein [Hyphomicrobium sp.]ODT19946.1 MAG: hypothetical protein ABS54_14570 [Hyphomicrobium sp. SCN 65-11]
MNAAAPGFLVALETSELGALIRQSAWIYPTANITHVVAIVLFAGAIAVMDVRLMGGMAGSDPARVVRGARRAAVLALIIVLVSGAVLFTAEASHVALNGIFQLKMALIAFGIVHAFFVGNRAVRALDALGPQAPMPGFARFAGALSMLTWLGVVGLGRYIAYN